MDVSSLSEEQIREELMQRGVNPGPVVATTRKVYERKLVKLLREEAGEIVEENAEEFAETRDWIPAESRPSVLQRKDIGGMDENETYEGEESYRRVSYPSSGHRNTSNMFETENNLSRRYVTTSARLASPRKVYDQEGRTSDRTAATLQGTSKMMWLKIGVFLVVAIFTFMLFRRMAEGGIHSNFDEEDTSTE